MDRTTNVHASEYLEIAYRRKWLIVVPFLLCSLFSLYLCVTLPSIYRSETTILVEPQQIPQEYVQSTVTGSVQDRLNTISQQILSRTMLESVIKEYALYPEVLASRSMEDAVHAMRNDIEIQVVERPSRNSSTPAAFTLAYSGKDPTTVQRVTNKLATLYIEENLKVRAVMAHGTKEFLEKQLREIEGELKSREEAIQTFKQDFMGELPEQLESNLRALDQLQHQRGSLLESLRNAEDRQVLLEKQLSEVPRYLAGGTDEAELHRQIGLKYQELRELKTLYTDLYPDVIRVKRDIEELTAKLAAREAGTDQGQEIPGTMINPAYQRLKEQRDANRLAIQNLRGDIGRIDSTMKTIQARIESVPEREQELMTLTRDYETIKKNYDSMMERKLNAEIAEDLETRQKSEQFRILDPPNYPEKPTRPNRLYLLGTGLLLGMGIGVGCAVAAEYLDRSLRSVDDVKSSLTVPLLEVIPVLHTSSEMTKRRRYMIAATLLSVGLALVALMLVHIFVIRIDTAVMNVVRLFL